MELLVSKITDLPEKKAHMSSLNCQIMSTLLDFGTLHALDTSLRIFLKILGNFLKEFFDTVLTQYLVWKGFQSRLAKFTMTSEF